MTAADQKAAATQGASVGGTNIPGDHTIRDTQSPAVAWGLLTIYADLVDDAERIRIATENRLRALRDVKGLEGTPEEQRLERMVSLLAQVEHMAILDLKRAMRSHPLGPWVKRTIGIGEKQGARLLAEIGDPGARRGPAQLWAYCGMDVRDGKAPKRARGIRSNWNESARMRVRLVAESCMKQRHSPYRAVYDRERAKWASRDTTDLHRHNHALRVVAKAVLLDLWREARAGAASTSNGAAPGLPAEERVAA